MNVDEMGEVGARCDVTVCYDDREAKAAKPRHHEDVLVLTHERLSIIADLLPSKISAAPQPDRPAGTHGLGQVTPLRSGRPSTGNAENHQNTGPWRRSDFGGQQSGSGYAARLDCLFSLSAGRVDVVGFWRTNGGHS